MDEVKGGRARKTWVEGVGGSGAYLLQEKGRKGEREQEMSCQRERATKSAEQRSSQLASVSSKICWTDEEQGRQLVGGAACESRVQFVLICHLCTRRNSRLLRPFMESPSAVTLFRVDLKHG